MFESRNAHVDAPNQERDAFSADYSALLDEIDYGVVVVRSDGRVVHANRQALVQLELHGLPSIWSSPFCRPAGRAGQDLAHGLSRAAERGLRGTVELRANTEAILLTIVPLPRAASDVEPLTLLLLQRPQICTQLALAGLVRMHGLTDAESAVLGALCNGEQPSHIASAKGVALSTVRTQILAIRSKLGVRGIISLLLLVARLPPMMGALRT